MRKSCRKRVNRRKKGIPWPNRGTSWKKVYQLKKNACMSERSVANAEIDHTGGAFVTSTNPVTIPSPHEPSPAVRLLTVHGGPRLGPLSTRVRSRRVNDILCLVHSSRFLVATRHTCFDVEFVNVPLLGLLVEQVPQPEVPRPCLCMRLAKSRCRLLRR